MPHFDIVKENNPRLTFRISKIQSDYDVKFEHSNEHFVGDIVLPEKWNIGVIVGGVRYRKKHNRKRSVCGLLHREI